MAGHGQILGYRRPSRQTRECLRALGVRVDRPGGWSESPARGFDLQPADWERVPSAAHWGRQQTSGNRLLARMKACGRDVGRVTLRGRGPVHEYFTGIGNVDIALDTIPYNGATTSLDALWMGVPIVGLHGDRGISRGTYSILRTLGADELIAQTVDEYVAANVRLARDREWRARLRQTLRPRPASSPLMRAPDFTRALDSRSRGMWGAGSGPLAGGPAG